MGHLHSPETSVAAAGMQWHSKNIVTIQKSGIIVLS
jgi:hypothetical protein